MKNEISLLIEGKSSPAMKESVIDSSCGCKMFFVDSGDHYDTRVEFCEEHDKLAAPLRVILESFDLVLSDISKRDDKK